MLSQVLVAFASLLIGPASSLECTGATCAIFPTAGTAVCNTIFSLINSGLFGANLIPAELETLTCAVDETRCMVVVYETTNSNGDQFAVKSYRCATPQQCQMMIDGKNF